MWTRLPVRIVCCAASAALIASGGTAPDKLTLDERIEISRGLTAEYATAKTVLPRAKKALVFNSDGSYDKSGWQDNNKQFGPAARVGDIVQITKVAIEGDKILLEINHGNKGNHGHWYDHVEVGMGGSVRDSISQ